jgi:hypothetical protein
MSFRDGWSIAHEVQLAAIAQPELIRRTKAYEDAGIDVMWWFGENVPQTARQWVEQRGQPFYVLKFRDNRQQSVGESSVSIGAIDPQARLDVEVAELRRVNNPNAPGLKCVDEMSYRHDDVTQEWMKKVLKSHWYPTRFRLLLSLLIWPEGPELHRIAQAIGLRKDVVTGAYGEVKKFLTRRNGSMTGRTLDTRKSGLALPDDAIDILRHTLPEAITYEQYLMGTVLGQLVQRAQDDSTMMRECMRQRARLLKKTGFPYPLAGNAPPG